MDAKWNQERDEKRAARQADQLRQMLSLPASRADLIRVQEEGMAQVASIALAIEALELLLVDKGLIGADDLMNRLTALAVEKKAQVDAAAAVAAPEPSRIIQI